MSEKVFNNEMLLKEHPLDHTEEKSEKCDAVVGTLDKQAETHRESREVTNFQTNEIKVVKVQEHKIKNGYKCNKCDRKYTEQIEKSRGV